MSIEVSFRIARPGFSLDVAFAAPPRGITALFGPSGSGKTTVLRCVAGLQRSEGRCRVNGELWQDGRHWVPTHRRAIGYVFQEASLFPHLTVRGNLDFGHRLIPRAERRIALDDAVELLGIAHLLQRDPAGLSGGERQRVAIARALLTAPRLLLMDEPLSALDHAARQAIFPYLERIHDTLDIPVLYVSHHPDEVARLADRMVLLEAGRVRASGPVDRMLTALRLPLAGTDGASAILSGTVSGHDEAFHLTYVTAAGCRFALPREDLVVGTHARIQIHARDVSLALRAHHDTSILNIVPAVVTEARDLDRTQLAVRLQLEDGATLLARITRRSGLALGVREGLFVYAQVKSVALVG